MLEVCTRVELADGRTQPIEALRASIDSVYAELSRQGFRCLGVALRAFGAGRGASRGEERGMTFLGFLALDDPSKAGVARVLDELRGLGVSLRVITGDNRLVAEAVARRLSLEKPRLLTGPELHAADVGLSVDGAGLEAA